MSTSPYSLDLREKVISFLENGHSKKETSVVFKLNQKTVFSWYNRYTKEGHYLPRKRFGLNFGQITSIFRHKICSNKRNLH